MAGNPAGSRNVEVYEKVEQVGENSANVYKVYNISRYGFTE